MKLLPDSLAGKLAFPLLLLGAVRAFAAGPTNPPVIAFGLTNAPLGNEEFYQSTVNSAYWLTGSSPTGTNGVSIRLGRAESAPFLSPDAYDIHSGYAMTAVTYGSLNGLPNRPLATMSGRKTLETLYRVRVDFSPLGARSLTYQVYRDGRLRAEATAPGGALEVSTSYNYPRVNPLWLQADGTVAALIDLSSEAGFVLPDDLDTTAVGNRLVIRANDPTNTVDYISRVDVTGTGGLTGFGFGAIRVSAFHRPHLAFGEALFGFAPDRLIVGTAVVNTNLGPVYFVDLLSVDKGVAIDLPGASRFEVQLEPVNFDRPGTTFAAGAIGIRNLGYGWDVGAAGIVNTGGVLQVVGRTAYATTNFLVQVYRDGVLAGASTGGSDPVGFRPLLNVTGQPQLIAAGALANSLSTRPGFFLRFDRVASFTTTNSPGDPVPATFDGDEVRILAADVVRTESINNFYFGTAGLESFVITGESEELPPPPVLDLARADGSLVFHWPDPNRIFRLEFAYVLPPLPAESDSYFSPYGLMMPMYSNGIASVMYPLTTNQTGGFFRLQRGMSPTTGD